MKTIALLSNLGIKMNETEELIKAIGEKHDCYCTFTIRSVHKDGGIDYGNTDYKSYISEDKGTRHKNHKTIEEVNERFNNFLSKKADKSERIREKIKSLEQNQESISDELKMLRYDLHLYE